MTATELDRLKEEKEQLQLQLKTLKQELVVARNKMKELDALKDEFVSIAAHELRTPMTAIQSYIWMTLSGKGGKLTEKQRSYLNSSYTAIQRLINLVNDLLNISRIESGRMDIKFIEVNLAELYQEIITEVTPRAKDLGLKISLSQDPPTAKPLVVADRDKIHEVLLNLIGNSFKFTPKGGSIEIKIVANHETIKTEVTDTGVGMSSASLRNLFKKFGFMKNSYRSQHEMEKGAGLGLFICKLIIDLHHGSISAASPGENLGTTIAFSLPKFTPKKLEESKKQQKQSGIDIIHYSIWSQASPSSKFYSPSPLLPYSSASVVFYFLT